MEKFEIEKINGRFFICNDSLVIGIASVIHIVYGNFSIEKKRGICKKLINKFDMKQTSKVVSEDRETLETFLRFLESRCYDG